MAGYKGHSSFNLLLALPALIAIDHSFFHSPFPLVLTFSGSFAYTTLFMSPYSDPRINSQNDQMIEGLGQERRVTT